MERLVLGLLLGWFGFGSAKAESPTLLSQRLQALVVAACETSLDRDPQTLSFAFGPVVSVRDRGSVSAGLRRELHLKGAGNESATVMITAIGGVIRRVRGELHDVVAVRGSQPILLIDAGPDCAVLHGREIDYDENGQALSLRHFDRNLKFDGLQEPLNPPVPDGPDPGGVAVAHIDSGVNYLLPFLAARLARSADGGLLGWDYWDEDDRPFDLDTGRSPFFPIRHGTTVASVLLREAPESRLFAYRYPRPDLARLAPLIDHAAGHGVKIVLMPLGSRTAEHWQAFVEAATSQSDMLFIVSAGNDGRDIDVEPLYPASFELDNMIVVTSSDAFGRLAEGSNWGASSVDLMVPGEKVAVIDHRGAAGFASGSSFAVPRVAALAARLAAENPDWTAKELKAAIRKRAGPSFERGAQKVRWGWIPNPADDG